MATGNNRDVELGIQVTTAGSEGILKLRDDVLALAKQGGAAAPEFNALANEIDRLAQQAVALETFNKAADEVDKLTVAEEAARKKASELSTELEAQAKSVDQLRVQEVAASQALRQAQTALAEKKDALATLRNETDASGKKTAEYKAQVQALTREIIETRGELRQAAQTYREAGAATDVAEKAQNKLQASFKRVTAEVGGAITALSASEQALRNAGRAAEEAGLATESLLQSEIELVTAVNASSAAADKIVADRQRQIDADKRLAQEEERLAIIVQSTLATQRAAAKAEADGIIRDYDRMVAAERAAAEAAKQAAAEIAGAFRTIGVQGTKDLQAEIERVRQAMNLLKTTGTLTGSELDQAFNQGQRRIKELELQIREANGTLTVTDRVMKGLNTTFGQFAAGFTVIEAVQRFSRAFFDANKNVESLRLGLGTILGSSQLAGQQIDFLRSVADRAGVSVNDISQSFIKFSASTKSANIPIEQTNALFAAVTQSAGTLGLSGERVSQVLDALGQIASKGTVSMEELRQQLGDSLPGALSLSAKGLGLTDAQLVKLVETGGLLARDFFPALTKGLQSQQAEVNTLSAAFQRVGNVFNQFLTTIGDLGAVDALKGALVGISVIISPLVIGITTLINLIFTLARAAGAFVGAGGGLINRLQAVKEVVDQSVDSQVKLIESYKGLVLGGDAAATSSGKLVESQKAVTTAASGTTLTLASVEAAAHGAAGSFTQFASATDQGALKASLAGQSYSLLRTKYGELVTASEKAIEVSDKLAKAKEVEGQVAESLANLTGSEVERLNAASVAAEGNAAALKKAADVRANALVQLEAYRDALIEESKRLGDPDGTRAKAIDEINKTIAARSAEAEKARESAEASKIDAAAKSLAVKSYQDNSAAISTLRQSLADANVVVREYQALQINGKKTQDDVNDAQIRAAKIAGLLADALKDQRQNLELATQSIKNKLSVTEASLNADLAAAQSLEALARSTGNETLAGYASIEQKRISVKIQLARADASRLEAAAIEAAAKASLEEIRATDPLNKAKLAAVEASLAAAKVKGFESEAAKRNAEALQSEINAILSGVNARGGSTGAINTDTDARERNTQSIDKQTDALRRQKDLQGKTSDGLPKNPDGSAAGSFNNTLPLDQAFAVQDKLRQGNLTQADLELVKAGFKQAQDALNYQQTVTRQSPGASSTEFINSTNALFNANRAALERLTAPAVGGLPGGAQTAPQASGGSRTVNINLNGISTQVNVASDADANALETILKQLASAKSRTV